MDAIVEKSFRNIDLGDEFFNSLKEDYPGFQKWFEKKSSKDEKAFVLEENGIQGFLYLKKEDEEDDTITPKLSKKLRLKVGTFKIDAHGTKLGERFIKIIIDTMFHSNCNETYVTIFAKHEPLIGLLKRYGFEHYGVKNSGAGTEEVYIKRKDTIQNNILLDYPRIKIESNNKYLLAIYPKYHTKMFPFSKLKTEKEHVIEDMSFTNCIEKVYLSAAYGIPQYKPGDMVVIYRTQDNGKPAYYSSVATSICVVEEIKSINDFKTYNDFHDYCCKHSVFTQIELKSFWNTKKYPYIIKMLYNVALKKRITREKLINDIGVDGDQRWTSIELSDDQFIKILKLGDVNESFIIH